MICQCIDDLSEKQKTGIPEHSKHWKPEKADRQRLSASWQQLMNTDGRVGRECIGVSSLTLLSAHLGLE